MDVSFNSNYVSFLWPILFIAFTGWILFTKRRDKYSALISVLTYATVQLFFYFNLNWHCYIYYIKYILIFFIFITGIIVAFKSKNLSFLYNNNKKDWIRICFSTLILLLFILINIYKLSMHFYNDEPIELTFPFKNGTFCIAGGGNSKNTIAWRFFQKDRIFLGCNANSFNYAVDIVKLNKFGLSSDGIIPKDLTKYEIFDETIYSPCDGVVTGAIDYYPDITDRPQDEIPQINYITIRNGDIYVTMIHLKKDSIVVKIGDKIKVGESIAKVGNSGMGNHYFAHLHIQAVKGSAFYDDGVPIKFNGKFPVKNDIFKISR